MGPQNAITIAFFLFGLVLLGFGIRIIIRRHAKLVLGFKTPGETDITLNLEKGPALLWGSGVLLIGLRIVAAFVITWTRGGDLDQVSASGSITAWAVVALVIASLWHIARKARSVYESPEVQKKISEKLQQAMDEKNRR